MHICHQYSNIKHCNDLLLNKRVAQTFTHRQHKLYMRIKLCVNKLIEKLIILHKIILFEQMTDVANSNNKHSVIFTCCWFVCLSFVKIQ